LIIGYDNNNCLVVFLKILPASAKEAEGKNIVIISRRVRKRMLLLLMEFNNILPCST